MPEAEAPTVETWGIAEVFGHDRYCGRLSEVSQFGVAMLRVEVPAVDGRPAFTKDFGGSAIFSITRTTKEIATHMAASTYVREPAILGLPAPRAAEAATDEDDFDDQWDDPLEDDEDDDRDTDVDDDWEDGE